MFMQPIIRETRRVEIEFSAEQIRALIANAGRQAAGIPEGAAVTVTTGGITGAVVACDNWLVEAVTALEVLYPTQAMLAATGEDNENSAKEARQEAVEPVRTLKPERKPEAIPAPALPLKTPFGTVWTADEDETLREIMKGNPQSGSTTVAKLAGDMLTHRSIRAIEQRIWKLKLDAPAKAANDATAAALESAIAAPKTSRIPGIASDLAQHLERLPKLDGWDWADDLRLLELINAGGQSLWMIAAELGKEAGFAVTRADRLTGYDSKTKARKFSRTQLISALKAMVAA